MLLPPSPSISTAFQFLLYGITLACYGLYLSSPRWHSFLFTGLMFQFSLGFFQVLLSIYRGFMRHHAPSKVYLLVVFVYTIIAVSMGDLSAFHLLPKLLFFVFPLFLATYALFLVDRDYYHSIYATAPEPNASDDHL